MPGPSARTLQPCWWVSATTPSICGASRPRIDGGAEAFGDAAGDGGRTIHRRQHQQHVARADAAVGANISVERGAGRGGQNRCAVASGHGAWLGRPERQAVGMHVASRRNSSKCDADREPKLADGLAIPEIAQRHLVPARDGSGRDNVRNPECHARREVDQRHAYRVRVGQPENRGPGHVCSRMRRCAMSQGITSRSTRVTVPNNARPIRVRMKIAANARSGRMLPVWIWI